jgi:hypothetical protein
VRDRRFVHAGAATIEQLAMAGAPTRGLRSLIVSGSICT